MHRCTFAEWPAPTHEAPYPEAPDTELNHHLLYTASVSSMIASDTVSLQYYCRC